MDDNPYKINSDYTTPEYIIPDIADPNIDLLSHVNDTHEESNTNKNYYSPKDLAPNDLTFHRIFNGEPDLDATLLGDMEAHFKSNPGRVTWSKANQNWHIKSGRNSQVVLSVNAHDIKTQEGIYFMRLTLIRRDKKYQKYKVDTLCDKHALPGDTEDKLKTIQKVDDHDNNYWYTLGAQRSLCAGCPWPVNGHIRRDLAIRFVCMDTCHNSTELKKIKCRARDLLLVVTLEFWEPTKN